MLLGSGVCGGCTYHVSSADSPCRVLGKRPYRIKATRLGMDIYCMSYTSTWGSQSRLTAEAGEQRCRMV